MFSFIYFFVLLYNRIIDHDKYLADSFTIFFSIFLFISLALSLVL